MEYIYIYLIITTIVNSIFAIIWTRDSLFNLCIRLYFSLFSLYGIFLLLKESGYIIKF